MIRVTVTTNEPHGSETRDYFVPDAQERSASGVYPGPVPHLTIEGALAINAEGSVLRERQMPTFDLTRVESVVIVDENAAAPAKAKRKAA